MSATTAAWSGKWIGRQPLSYLFDIGFTRDVWAHRIGIAHAIAVEPDHDAAHDGRILADIIAEWAATHGEPFTLASTVQRAAPSCTGPPATKSTSASSISSAHSPSGPPRAAWEARVLFEETTRTLLCGDLLTQLGHDPALTSNDVLAAAAQAEGRGPY